MVDFLRTGYTASFRFPTTSGDQTYTFRYVAADPLAPALSSGSIFNSLVWGDSPQYYGEIPGTRRWAPLVAQSVPVGFPDGTADQLAGVAPCDVIQRVPVGELQFPPFCVESTLSPIAAPFSANDLGDLGYLASLVYACYNYSFEEFSRYVAATLDRWATNVELLSNVTAINPTSYAIDTTFGGLLVCEGTTSELQFLGEVISTALPPYTVGSIGGAAGAMLAALTLAAQCGSILSDASKGLVAIGHSYGGPVAELAALVFTSTPGRGLPASVTFGSPRLLNSAAEISLSQARYRTSVRAVGDVVPFLPPYSQFLPWLLPLVGSYIGSIYSLYRSNPIGLWIDASGAAYSSAPDPNSIAFEALITTAFATGLFPGFPASHSITNYLQLLSGPYPWRIPGWLSPTGAAAYRSLLAVVNP